MSNKEGYETYEADQYHVVAFDKDNDDRPTLLCSSGDENLAKDLKKEFENDDRWLNLRIEKELKRQMIRPI